MLSGGAQLRGVHHRCCKKIMLALFCLYPAKKEGCRTPLVMSDIRGGRRRRDPAQFAEPTEGSGGIHRPWQSTSDEPSQPENGASCTRVPFRARQHKCSMALLLLCSRPRRFVSPSRLTHPPTKPIHPSIIERYNLNVRSGLGDKVKDEDRSKYPASSGQWSLFQSNGVPYCPRFASRDFLKTQLATGSLDRNAMQCT